MADSADRLRDSQEAVFINVLQQLLSLIGKLCVRHVELERPLRTVKKPHEEELAMLDLAVGVTEWSRLGCQIKLTDELDGITVALPGG